MSFQNLVDASLADAITIPPVKEFIITFPSSGSYASEITWNIKRSDGTAVINGNTTTNTTGTQNVSSTELTYDGSYVLNMFDSYGDTWNGAYIIVNSTDASGNTYERVTDNTGPANGVTHPTGASVNLNEIIITPKTEVVRADLQSMIALGHTIPALVAGGIYTNQLIKAEFSGADVLELATSSYGSLTLYELLSLGYTNSELGVYFETWIKLGLDIDGEASGDESGRCLSLNSDGTIVAICAYKNDGNGNLSGHTRIYQYSSDSWTQLGTDIDGEAAGDQSGWSVSLSSDGTIVAIGAMYNDGNGNLSGHTRIYQYSSGAWTQLGADIDGEAAGDQSGWSVSLSSDGTIVAIGAVGNDGTTGNINDNRGHVRVYQYSSGSWTQLGMDIDGEASGDQSGYSVSLSSDGTNVAISANSNDGTSGSTSDNRGHTRVYNLTVPVSPVGICFPAGTPVTTDQGNIPIEKLKSHIHTIRGKSIVAITETRLLKKHIVSIEKDALVKNVPSQTTHISRSHKLFFKGRMIKAEDLVDVCEHVNFIPYNGKTLYNVVLEKQGNMMINNLICETLCPYNIMALISKISDRTEKNRKIKKITSIIMKNDKAGYKKLYSSLLK